MPLVKKTRILENNWVSLSMQEARKVTKNKLLIREKNISKVR